MQSASATPANSEAQPIVFGVKFTELSLLQIAEAVTNGGPPAGSGLWTIVTMNLDHAVTLRRNERFRAAYRNAKFVTADGLPVYLYARWRGTRLSGRVTGADLLPLIMERLQPGRDRLFLAVSSELTGRLFEQRLTEAGFGADEYAVVTPPFGFETDIAASEAILERIETLKPTHIIMGVGAPKSEIWLDLNRDRMGDAYGFAFGAGLDFLAGTVRRAPKFVRDAGFEWFWRFASEPRRLFKRYFVDSWAFFAAIADDLRDKGRSDLR